MELKGFVRNDFDGKVYIEIEGRKEQVIKFTEWLHIGSPLSKVSEVTTIEGSFKNYSTFEIRN